MINPLNPHYSFTNPASIHDEEALTALELSGRIGKKLHELITAYNALEANTEDNIAEIEEILNKQNELIDLIKTETVPEVVVQEVQKFIEAGKFNAAISEYVTELEARLDNLLSNLPEGGTTLDAEVIDIRIDENGIQHTNAGGSVRNMAQRIKTQASEMAQNHGVYTVPLTFEDVFNTTENRQGYFESLPFKIPEGGFSCRVMDFGPFTPNGVESKFMTRVALGTMVGGEFIEDTTLTTRYCYGAYTNRVYYVPEIDSYYARIRLNLIGENEGQLYSNNYQEYTYLKNQVKVYAGRVAGGGNMLGASPATLRSHETEGYMPTWSMNGLVYKFSCMTSPLPLKHVSRVVCQPDVWLGAKVYKFDPITRKSEYVETLNYNQNHPCFGTECILDFSEYGSGYYAILTYGRVPLMGEYTADTYNGTAFATANVTNLGLDLSDLNSKVRVDWCVPVDSARRPGSPIVQRNIELLKTLKHRSVTGMYGRDNTQAYNYIFGKKDMAGAFYGGSYGGGSLFYHISPATYYAAMLNPNSNVYGDVDPDESGYNYGLVCSVFTSLVHGWPLPLSVFDLRYSHYYHEWYDTYYLSTHSSLDYLKPYDLLVQGVGATGHAVLLTDVKQVGDEMTALNVMEAATPSTRENVFPLHSGSPYYKSDPENWFHEAYDFACVTNAQWDEPINDKANWIAPYTEPQRVMCNRGFGAVYVMGKTQMILSVDPDVTRISVSLNGADVGTFVPADMSETIKNGYRLVNITSKVNGPGTVKVRNDLDDSVEEFHVIDTSDYTVGAELETEEDGLRVLKITTNHPEKVKFLNIIFKVAEGDYAGNKANVSYEPKFTDGVMTIPAEIKTEHGTYSMDNHDPETFRDYVNVIFKTDYDTNTFSMDAEGDAFI